MSRRTAHRVTAANTVALRPGSRSVAIASHGLTLKVHAATYLLKATVAVERNALSWRGDVEDGLEKLRALSTRRWRIKTPRV